MDQLINTVDYTIPQLVIAGIGALLWVTAYMLTIRNIVKHQFVEMPVFFACGNIVWEFLWGFVFYEQINMGILFVWSFRIWFIIDIFIYWNVFKYGYKQITLEPLRRNAKKIFAGLTVAYISIFATFIHMGLDYPMGAQTAYFLNFGFASAYILIFLRIGHKEHFSKKVAWFKMLGTLMYNVFFVMAFPEQIQIVGICIVIFVVDLVYLYMIYNYSGDKHPQLNKA
jgi:hypothetical protein